MKNLGLLAIALLTASTLHAQQRAPVSRPRGPYRAACRGPPRAHDAGREDRADHRDLDAEEPAVRPRRTVRSCGGAPPVPERHRPICPARAICRGPAVRSRLRTGTCARRSSWSTPSSATHCGTRLGIPVLFHEEGLAWLCGARRHALSASDRAGEHLGSGAARAGVHGRRPRDSRARRAAGARSRRRRRARSALGPHRGNVRRRPVPRRRAGCCGRARLSGPTAAARHRIACSRR